jgi:hypothetical protein
MELLDGAGAGVPVPRRGGEVVAHWFAMSALTPNYRSNEANRSGSSSSRPRGEGKRYCMVESIKEASNGLDRANARSCPIPDRNALVAVRGARGGGVSEILSELGACRSSLSRTYESSSSAAEMCKMYTNEGIRNEDWGAG